MFTLCPSASLLRVLMRISLKIVTVLLLLSSVKDEILIWAVIADCAGAGCGYCLMDILKQPWKDQPQLSRQETSVLKQ